MFILTKNKVEIRKNFFFLFLLLFISCTSNKKEIDNFEKGKPIEVNQNLIIGNSEQPDEYQLGDPIGIRTDSLGNIYIADRATLKIKKFNREGLFLKTIGKRGRGPGEFYDINSFELTAKGDFFIVDKGNIRYTIVGHDGKELFSKKIDISKWQFYPKQISFLKDKIISLYHDPNRVNAINKPMFEREMFYEYSLDLDHRLTAFLPYKELVGLQDKAAWVNFVGTPGSFIIEKGTSKPEIIYSPRVYNGNFYQIKNEIDSVWSVETFHGIKPAFPAFEKFEEAEFDVLLNKKLPGLFRNYFDKREPYRGRINVADEGIFRLKNGKIVQFRSQWSHLKSNQKPDSTNVLDIYVQLFDENLNLERDSYLFSLENRQRLRTPIINWKDQNDEFYYIVNTKNFVLVKRFKLVF